MKQMNAEKFASFLIESSNLPPLLNNFPSPKLHLALELTVVLSNTNTTKYRFISSVLLQCSSASSTDLTVLTIYAKTRLEESDRWKRGSCVPLPQITPPYLDLSTVSQTSHNQTKMKMNSNEIKEDFALPAIFPFWLWSKKRLETGRVRICIYIMRARDNRTRIAGK